MHEPRATIAASKPPYRACFVQGDDLFLGQPDFDRVKLCHCGSSRNPSQAPLPAGFRETGRGGQLFPSGSSAALLVIWGYINSYANKRTAQGSVAPGELGRASASKFRRMPMRPAPTETAPRVAEGLRVFCRYRRERGWDNVPKTTARRPDNMLSGFRIRRASLVQRAILARYPLTAFSCGIWERSFAPRRGAVLVGGRAFLRPLNTGVTGILLKA